LTLGEQPDGSFGDQRKGLIAQGFQWGERTRRHHMDGFCTGFRKFLGSFLMHLGR